MATSIEIRRADYTGAGVYRTAEGDTRANLTGIKLQVDSLQEGIDRKINVLPLPEDPENAFVIDLGMGVDTFTLKGAVTSDTANSVHAVHIMLDLRYATQFWRESGLISLVWTDEGDTGVTHTYSGFITISTFNYTAGEVNLFPFTLQFVRGKITS